MQTKDSVEEQKRNLEAREAKLSEVKDLIPSARQLKDMGIGFSQVQSFITYVKERAVEGMIEPPHGNWLRIYNCTVILGDYKKRLLKRLNNFHS